MTQIQAYVRRLALQRNKYTKNITSGKRLHRRYLFISQIRLVDRNNPHHTLRNARAVADHDSELQPGVGRLCLGQGKSSQGATKHAC
jgi:hypothetical protein